jgi:catechol 2,3-dioxygenase-like lactoylglutathione lyase family enzyme
MNAKLKHLAIRSENYAMLSRFYQAVFGMRASAGNRPEGAPALFDGYLGLNFNPRQVGGWARLDHFGFEIDSVEEVEERIRDAYPQVHMLQRPSNRPFAGITMHDPAGNYFDLSTRSMENRRDVYTEASSEQAPRYVHHVALRAVEPEPIAEFYRDVFDLVELERGDDDPSYYLFDGRVTLVITPWQIADYAHTGVGGPGLDHIGFAVESMAALEADLDRLRSRNPRLQAMRLDYGPEGTARLRLFERCKFGQRQFADPDAVLLDVVEA